MQSFSSQHSIEGLLTADSKRALMRISITQAILVITISTAFICLSHASCSGSCSISSGGGTSSDFLGDPSFDPNMDTLNDFVSNSIGQTPLFVQSIMPEAQSNNSSLNQTNRGNVSLNNNTEYNSSNITANQGKGTSNNTTVKLGGSATKDVKQSAFASTIFENNNNMF